MSSVENSVSAVNTETIADEDNEDSDLNDPPIIPGFSSFNDYVTEGYKKVMEGVKASNSLPSGRNFCFYQTFTNFRDVMNECGTQMQDVMMEVMKSQEVSRQLKNVMLEDALDVLMHFNDKLLDRGCRYMDMMEGIKTGLSSFVASAAPVSGSWNKNVSPKANTVTLAIPRNLPRPQFTFRDKIDNSNTAWVPPIKDKPNSVRPLSILLEMTADGDECFSHPYEYELDMWSVPEKQLSRTKTVRPRLLEQTPYQFIGSEDDLNLMMEHLKAQEAIAIDLEHHSYRSFMGFTCLIQISTKEKDFVIDAIALRHALQVLNEVFTKPSLLKVFHGADMDIGWLQRDFGVYVVNMFDTHQASKLLNYPKLSLGYLLSHFCNINANKHFQLFDWRTRPLPEAAEKYAREDTHYLLFIQQAMANQLLDRANGSTNLLQACYERSKQICKKRFTKMIVDEESHMTVYRKGKRLFDNRQLHALKGLYLWRDKTAREQDESLAYVLPEHMMLHIAETLPREAQGILACCNPIPPLVKSNLIELHYLIINAKEQPLVKVIPESNPVPVVTTKAVGDAAELQKLEQWYHPSEARDDLPTLLDGSLPEPPPLDDGVSPTVTMFEEKSETEEVDKELRKKLRGLHFVSPYQRYVRVLPYVVQLEKEDLERERLIMERKKQELQQKQAQAQEIKAVEGMGIIKLDKEEKEEEEEDQPLKIKLIKGNRKRKSNEVMNGVPAKVEKDGDVKLEQRLELRGELEVKEEAVRPERPPDKKRGSWKEFKMKQKLKQEKQNFEAFDYSKVDFNKFQSGRMRNQQNKQQPKQHFQKGKRKDVLQSNKFLSSKKKKGKW